MIDAKTLSYINLYAILGALTQLCELEPKAKEILGKKKITMEIAVKTDLPPVSLLKTEAVRSSVAQVSVISVFLFRHPRSLTG